MQRYFIWVLLILLFCSSSWARTETRISSITIKNGSHISEKEIRDILPVREGDLWNDSKKDLIFSLLKKWGRFEKMDLEVHHQGEAVSLDLTLQEGPVISRIDTHGTYPFLSSRIRRLIAVHSGDLYNAQKAEEETKKIRSFYERKGYFGTEVTEKSFPNEKKGTMDLSYKIQKGKRVRMGTITHTGSVLFPHGYFVSKLNPLLFYDPNRLKRNLETIRKDYQKKGFLKARVHLKDLGLDPEKGFVNPVLEITEGKNIRVSFNGNHRVSARTFKKILPLFLEGGTSDYELENSATVIANYYHQLGFQEISVVTQKKEMGNQNLLVTFAIQEGPQTHVKKIRFESLQKVDASKIKKDLLTQENKILRPNYYEPSKITIDFGNLPNLLINQGALEAKVLEPSAKLNGFHDQAEVLFKVEEGPITALSKIVFEGNVHLKDRRLKRQLTLDEGKPFSPQKLEDDKKSIILEYANHGFPYTSVASELLQNGSETTLVFKIQEGTPVSIGEILLVGNERTRKHPLERLLLIKKGDPFSTQKILESEALLRRTGSFRSVNIETIGLEEKLSIVHLIIRMEEYKSLLLDIGGNYDTDKQFTGTISINHINLFGGAKRANLKLTGGGELQKAETLLQDPNFLSSRLETSLGSFIDRQVRPGFQTREAGGSVSVLRDFKRRLTLLGRYEINRTFFTDVTDNTGLPQADHTTSTVSVSANFDQRDSFADPQRGYVIFLGTDFSNKLIASNFNFLQPKGHFVHFLSLGNRLTLMNYIRIEGIKVFDGETLARDKKLFLGGDYSLRGFAQDAVGPIATDGRPGGGLVLIHTTTELQLRLFDHFKGALFLDNGSLTDTLSDMGSSSFRQGAGLGLRYITPIGPLRLDYGFKLDRAAGESPGRLHFAFGYAF